MAAMEYSVSGILSSLLCFDGLAQREQGNQAGEESGNEEIVLPQQEVIAKRAGGGGEKGQLGSVLPPLVDDDDQEKGGGGKVDSRHVKGQQPACARADQTAEYPVEVIEQGDVESRPVLVQSGFVLYRAEHGVGLVRQRQDHVHATPAGACHGEEARIQLHDRSIHVLHWWKV